MIRLARFELIFDGLFLGNELRMSFLDKGRNVYYITSKTMKTVYMVDAGRGTLIGTFEAFFDIEGISDYPPLYVPEDSDLVRTLTSVFYNKTGVTAKPVAIGGGTYARTLPNILAFGPLLPGDQNIIHKPDENISTERLLLLSKIYAQAMYELAK